MTKMDTQRRERLCTAERETSGADLLLQFLKQEGFKSYKVWLRLTSLRNLVGGDAKTAKLKSANFDFRRFSPVHQI